MSLKRRNIIAWLLLLLAAITWVFGQRMLSGSSEGSSIAETVMENTESAAPSVDEPPPVPETYPSGGIVTVESHRRSMILGFLLSFAGLSCAAGAVFVLRQKSPLLGPDGAAVLAAITGWAYDALPLGSTSAYIPWRILLIFAALVSVRELWGWIRSKLSLSWCMVSRLAQRCPAPQWSLTVFAGWIAAAALGTGMVLIRRPLLMVPLVCTVLAGICGVCCLWKYGTDLHHFQAQLDSFRNGKPVTVGEGTFAQAEAQLLQAQARHEEAVHSAVTSERFKVELIANVSHDLRTPLTSILGYGELLQQESLSPAGQEQLARLNQKAGYMRDLLESLFELTKVSSGVLEPKKEEIDLIRLLEQTIGLFDDRLTEAGLVVRRHYAADTIPVTTDGARMHQVFANLLSNAIKYAMPGTRIYLEVREEDRRFVIRMVNTSSYEMDFAPEEIIQRFARGDKARSTQGSGLGLAIAQTYTESVGGRFRVAVDGDQFSAIVELPKTERNL